MTLSKKSSNQATLANKCQEIIYNEWGIGNNDIWALVDKYVEEFNGDICTYAERDCAIHSFRKDKELELLDVELIPYLEKLLNSHILVPVFSCVGHEDKPGYVLFRSMYGLDQTLDIFKPVLLKYDIIEEVSLRIHYWNYNSIGYSFYFNKEYLDQTLSYLIGQLEQIRR